MTLPPSGLAHPPITWTKVRAAPAATLINMGRAPGAPDAYQLVWVTGPDGRQGLYQLVPESRQTPDTNPTSEP